MIEVILDSLRFCDYARSMVKRTQLEQALGGPYLYVFNWRSRLWCLVYRILMTFKSITIT